VKLLDHLLQRGGGEGVGIGEEEGGVAEEGEESPEGGREGGTDGGTDGGREGGIKFRRE